MSYPYHGEQFLKDIETPKFEPWARGVGVAFIVGCILFAFATIIGVLYIIDWLIN